MMNTVLTVALVAAVRPSDTVARIGGDEFVVLLEGVAGDDIVIPVCDRILSESAREFEIDGQSIFVTVSIGIAHSSGAFDSVDDLVQNARPFIGARHPPGAQNVPDALRVR